MDFKGFKMKNAPLISTTKVTFKEISKVYLKVSLKRYCYTKQPCQLSKIGERSY